ncbi:hypothetical protein HBI56_061040 [Parastagonospora nodorum]|uniref:Uncharacterized protein n=1 Tax=Phaeosphaeria nodorum (strain SN15 / ATCC MYA-4574 / FGSC 10173) TaxID=321614 RepID=A0A7U2F2B1_PHANO|nr:hypothetical protein HBH56_157550 [Parastagonospora nodorum]QRC97451.1 hypothetical protein JI435_410560 [Parastagonospora nodorum SN15]KAH3922885.1 hypothetical protein HBH54_217190 [Parastagonospora nodorum]KAH3946911.1 hypothetical protein HBH53_124350 [Parastagonospora nodorum]KAH3969532.1 hypothetical protein HBH52_172350 [Parastagonospora nodorum]
MEVEIGIREHVNCGDTVAACRLLAYFDVTGIDLSKYKSLFAHCLFALLNLECCPGGHLLSATLGSSCAPSLDSPMSTLTGMN